MEDTAERISSLKLELKSYGKDITDNIHSLYSNSIVDSFDMKNNSAQILKILHHDVTEMLQLSNKHSVEYAAHAADIRECSKLVDLLIGVSNVSESILQCEQLISNLALKSSCEALKNVQNALDELPSASSDIGTGSVCSLLRKEHNIQKSRFVSKLYRLLGECIQFEKGRVVVVKILKGVSRAEDMIINEPIRLTDIWDAITCMAKNDQCVDGVLRNFWINIIRPLWKEKRPQPPHVVSGEEKSELAFDNILRDLTVADNAQDIEHAGSLFSELGATRIPIHVALEYIGQTISFLWLEIFCTNAKIIETAARKFAAPPIALMALLTDAIVAHMPKNEVELSSYRRNLEQPCQLLDAKIKMYGLEQPSANTLESSDNPGFLAKFLSELTAIYSENRRRDVLDRARELVLAEYHNTMTGNGDAADDELASAGDIGDPKAVLEQQSASFSMQALKFDACQISLTACRLLKFIQEVMKSATESSPAMAKVYVHAARDCIDLFSTIVPVRFANVIKNDVRMGAVFFNDCLYIAHNATVLTHKYRIELSKLDEVFARSVAFTDFIPRIRMLGDDCMTKHADLQRTVLVDLVNKKMKISPSGSDAAVSNGGIAGPAGGGSSKLSMPSISVEMRPGGLLSAGQQLAGLLRSNVEQAVRTAVSTTGPSSSTSAPAMQLDPAGRGSLSNGGGGSSASGYNSDVGAEMVAAHLRMLVQQWRNVLQDAVFSRLIGSLIECVLETCIQPLLEADCIDADAGVDIARMLKTIQKAARLCVSSDGRDEDNNAGFGSSVFTAVMGNVPSSESIVHLCPSWRKFLALTDLLEYSLSEIAQQLPLRKFSAFTGNEMTSLIKALFDDSPRRQSVLAAIAQMSS